MNYGSKNTRHEIKKRGGKRTTHHKLLEEKIALETRLRAINEQLNARRILAIQQRETLNNLPQNSEIATTISQRFDLLLEFAETNLHENKKTFQNAGAATS